MKIGREQPLLNPIVPECNEIFESWIIDSWCGKSGKCGKAELSENDLNNPALPSHRDHLVKPHSEEEEEEEEGKKYKQFQHGGVKGEESPSPHHCPHTLQARIACKITFCRAAGGWRERGIHCFGMGQWVCVIKSLNALTRERACASLTKCLHKTHCANEPRGCTSRNGPRWVWWVLENWKSSSSEPKDFFLSLYGQRAHKNVWNSPDEQVK